MRLRLAIPALCLLLGLLSGCGAGYTEAELELAREAAYQSGYEAGFLHGTEQCGEASYREGYSAGESAGYETGRTAGFQEGAQAQQEAFSQEAGDTFRQGYESGYQEGYARQEADAAAASQAYLSQVQARTAVSEPPAEAVLPLLPTEEPSGGGERTLPGDGAAVYVTKSGSKYHRDGCAYLSSSRIEKSLEEAKAAGYTPCSKCNPPK